MTVESEIHDLILMLNKTGHKIPVSITGFTNVLNFQSFEGFTNDRSAGKISILKHSKEISSSLFYLIARPRDKALAWLAQALFWINFPCSLALSIFVSWWFLLAMPDFYFMGSKLILSIYASAVIYTATKYEAGFCLLFYSGQISVCNLENAKLAFFESEYAEQL